MITSNGGTPVPIVPVEMILPIIFDRPILLLLDDWKSPGKTVVHLVPCLFAWNCQKAECGIQAILCCYLLGNSPG